MWPLDRQITRAQPGRGSAGQGLQARLEAATWLGVVGGACSIFLDFCSWEINLQGWAGLQANSSTAGSGL